MARESKTLGGRVIVAHGIRVWWHVQRALIVWLVTTELLGRDPTWLEVVDASRVSEATLARDMRFFRQVWPDESISSVCARIRSARPSGSAEDAVLSVRAI